LNQSKQKISHVLITRPRSDADRLAAMLASTGIESIVQPAQEFEPRALTDDELSELVDLEPPVLLIFTSPRAVEFGLSQLPQPVSAGAKIAAIGPATAQSLAAAGKRVDIQPGQGYTSEALLQDFARLPGERGGTALVMCAPGGREVLTTRLGEMGWNARPVWVYERQAAELSGEAVTAINAAQRLLTVFTSAEAMNVFSQRLPPSAWYAVCRGEWLVISERLQRLARAFGPSEVHQASGPRNADLATAIRSIY
jgi:uroporphyrinogen-III synthase